MLRASSFHKCITHMMNISQESFGQTFYTIEVNLMTCYYNKCFAITDLLGVRMLKGHIISPMHT